MKNVEDSRVTIKHNKKSITRILAFVFLWSVLFSYSAFADVTGSVQKGVEQFLDCSGSTQSGKTFNLSYFTGMKADNKNISLYGLTQKKLKATYPSVKKWKSKTDVFGDTTFVVLKKVYGKTTLAFVFIQNGKNTEYKLDFFSVGGIEALKGERIEELDNYLTGYSRVTVMNTEYPTVYVAYDENEKKITEAQFDVNVDEKGNSTLAGSLMLYESDSRYFNRLIDMKEQN